MAEAGSDIDASRLLSLLLRTVESSNGWRSTAKQIGFQPSRRDLRRIRRVTARDQSHNLIRPQHLTSPPTSARELPRLGAEPRCRLPTCRLRQISRRLALPIPHRVQHELRPSTSVEFRPRRSHRRAWILAASLIAAESQRRLARFCRAASFTHAVAVLSRSRRCDLGCRRCARSWPDGRPGPKGLLNELVPLESRSGAART